MEVGNPITHGSCKSESPTPHAYGHRCLIPHLVIDASENEVIVLIIFTKYYSLL